MLEATILTFFTTNNSTHCVDSEIIPAGSEYIIEDKLPEKRLPIKIFTTSVIKPYLTPSISEDKSIKTFESPNLVPGNIIGGKRDSIKKANVESAERIAHRVILEIFLFINHPTIGLLAVSPIGLISKSCGLQ